MNAKTALYARVSTRDKDQTPELQLAPMRAHAAAAGWDVVEYVDKASAADYVRRTAWAQLRADVRRYRVSQVLVWKLDRAFRSTTECLNTLAEWDGLGTGFLVLTQPEINTRSPIGRLIFAVLAAVAEFERDLIRDRVSEGMANARRTGTKSGLPIGRPAALSRSSVRRQWKELEAKVRVGDVSRRQSARQLGVGLGTIQRLLTADPKRDPPAAISPNAP